MLQLKRGPFLGQAGCRTSVYARPSFAVAAKSSPCRIAGRVAGRWPQQQLQQLVARPGSKVRA